MRNELLNVVVALLFSVSGAAVLAEHEGPGDAPPAAPPAEPDKAWWVAGQLEFTTAYYYRGFFQENQGLIAQPAMKLGYDIFHGDGWLNRVSPVVGWRASLQSKDTAAQEDPRWVYELDALAGAQFTFFHHLNAEALYVNISSPNGAFDTIHEFDMNLQFDDTGLWGQRDFAIKPFANFKVEMGGSAAGGPEGAMVEAGIEPEVGIIKSPAFPLRVSFPTTVGLSIDNYYFLPGFGPFPAVKDETFGYVKTGVTFLLPLTWIAPDHGKWALTVGMDYIYLGNNLELFNRGKESDLIGRIGFVVRY